MNRKRTKQIVYSGLMLALCMVLPFLTGQIPQIGSALSPMHIPVFLCGFICGPICGAVVGLIAPMLRFLLFGMPPIFPTGIAMALELAAYGAVTGLLFNKLPRRLPYIYLSLASAMIIGRVVWGLARYLLTFVSQSVFTFDMFLAGAFVTAVPGIICHIVLVPLIILALMRAKLIPDADKKPTPVGAVSPEVE